MPLLGRRACLLDLLSVSSLRSKSFAINNA